MPVDPASLHIRIYPDAVLRKKAAPVTAFDDTLRAVVRRMFEVMAEEVGIGLAAPQVGLPWRLFVLNVPPPKPSRGDPDEPPSEYPTFSQGRMVFVNPVLSNPSGVPEPDNEGCLSLPDIRGDVLRPPVITATARDEFGKEFTITAAGLLARCIQHEYDHLDGVLILDRMSQMSRIKNRAAIKDLERE
ncbi:MAG TPA: peptide deformylase [Phycisphaerales bacterium]|nr:peptide deformylase [Phycisphaerales bacterium]